MRLGRLSESGVCTYHKRDVVVLIGLRLSEQQRQLGRREGGWRMVGEREGERVQAIAPKQLVSMSPTGNNAHQQPRSRSPTSPRPTVTAPKQQLIPAIKKSPPIPPSPHPLSATRPTNQLRCLGVVNGPESFLGRAGGVVASTHTHTCTYTQSHSRSLTHIHTLIHIHSRT